MNLDTLLDQTPKKLITLYEKLILIADMKNRVFEKNFDIVFHNQLLEVFSKEEFKQVNNFMHALRDVLEDSVENYTTQNNLVDYQGFGGSDATLDVLYWIVWQGLKTVQEYTANPQKIIDMYDNDKYEECLWALSYFL